MPPLAVPAPSMLDEPGMHPLVAALATATFLGPLSLDAQGADDGVALFEARRYAEARPAFEAAFRANPHDARAAYHLGRIALVEGNGDQGARWLERAVELDGGRAEYHHWLGRAYSRQAAHAGRFRQLRLAGHIRGELERAVQLDPNDVDARLDLLQYYVVAPGIVGGGNDKARVQAAEIRRLNPFRGHLADAAVAEDAGDTAGAEREFQAAVAAHPDSLAGAWALGSFYQRHKQWDRAFDVFERAAREHHDPVALYHVGRTASLSGQRLDRGAEALRQYLAARPRDTDPSLASAHYRLGLIYEKLGRRDAARDEFTSTVRLDPSQSEAREALKRVQ